VVHAIEVGRHPGYQGDGLQAKVVIGVELHGVERDNGRPFVLYRTMTYSYNEKAILSEYCRAVGVDTVLELVGKGCHVVIDHRESGAGKTFAAIKAVTRLPSGTTGPEPVTAPEFYDFEEPDDDILDRVPPWVKEMAAKGLPYQERKPELEMAGEYDNDVPF